MEALTFSFVFIITVDVLYLDEKEGAGKFFQLNKEIYNYRRQMIRIV
jgi:hypothetical protein